MAPEKLIVDIDNIFQPQMVYVASFRTETLWKLSAVSESGLDAF
jgi:hypothetical protein